MNSPVKEQLSLPLTLKMEAPLLTLSVTATTITLVFPNGVVVLNRKGLYNRFTINNVAKQIISLPPKVDLYEFDYQTFMSTVINSLDQDFNYHPIRIQEFGGETLYNAEEVKTIVINEMIRMLNGIKQLPVPNIFYSVVHFKSDKFQNRLTIDLKNSLNFDESNYLTLSKESKRLIKQIGANYSDIKNYIK